MINIEYLKGDATAPAAPGKKIICHICNDVGGWGAGFVLAISKRWKEPEQAYRTWYRSKDNFQLGEIQLVPVGEDITVANMIGQRDIRPSPEGPPIRYDAVRMCLEKLAATMEADTSVHMPRIGCGLAGGKWGKIEPIIASELSAKDIRVVVYDL